MGPSGGSFPKEKVKRFSEASRFEVSQGDISGFSGFRGVCRGPQGFVAGISEALAFWGACNGTFRLSQSVSETMPLRDLKDRHTRSEVRGMEKAPVDLQLHAGSRASVCEGHGRHPEGLATWSPGLFFTRKFWNKKPAARHFVRCPCGFAFSLSMPAAAFTSHRAPLILHLAWFLWFAESGRECHRSAGLHREVQAKTPSSL